MEEIEKIANTVEAAMSLLDHYGHELAIVGLGLMVAVGIVYAMIWIGSADKDIVEGATESPV
jgi:hypothetical protein